MGGAALAVGVGRVWMRPGAGVRMWWDGDCVVLLRWTVLALVCPGLVPQCAQCGQWCEKIR